MIIFVKIKIKKYVMSINNFLLNTIFQNKHIKVLVTYGSQTGNVEAVSQILFNKN